MKKTISSVLLTLCAASAMALTPNGQGVYEISFKQDMLDFAALVNAGTTAANAVLMKDIDMGYTEDKSIENSWCVPIGTITNKYSGTFDGQGYAIKNFFIYQKGNTALQAYKCVGLFGATEGATIKNLTINASVECNFEKPETGAAVAHCGVLAGGISGTTIKDCVVNANVFTNYKANVGGICGAAAHDDFGKNRNTIDRCYVSGNWRIRSNGSYGALCGYVYNLELKNSYSLANMAQDGSRSHVARIGGLIGYANVSASARKLEITSCYNYGTISWTATQTGDVPVLGALGGRLTGTQVFLNKCYYLNTSCLQAIGDVSSAETPAENIPSTAATANEMTNGTVTAGLGSAFVQGTNYPVLSKQPTSLEQPSMQNQTNIKIVKDGKLYIVREGKVYSVLGTNL